MKALIMSVLVCGLLAVCCIAGSDGTKTSASQNVKPKKTATPTATPFYTKHKQGEATPTMLPTALQRPGTPTPTPIEEE